MIKNIIIVILVAFCGLLFGTLNAAQGNAWQLKIALDEQLAINADDLVRLNQLATEYKNYNVFAAALAAVDKEYNRANNNCFDHSVALQQELRKRGVESSIFINENRNHAWIGVWVEATSGDFIDPTKNNLHPIELRSDRNTVIFADSKRANVGVSTSSFPLLFWK